MSQWKAMGAATDITHPVCCQNLQGQRVPQHSKPPELIGNVLPTQDRNVKQDTIVDEVQQAAVADTQLG